MINVSGGGEFKFGNTAQRRSAENIILSGRTIDGESRKILFKGKPISLSDMRGLSDLEVAGISKLVGNSVGSSPGENAKIADAAKDILNSDDFDVSRVLTAEEQLKQAIQNLQTGIGNITTNSDVVLTEEEKKNDPFITQEGDEVIKGFSILAATRAKPTPALAPENSPPSPLPPLTGGPDHRARLRPKESEKDFIYGREGNVAGSVNNKTNNILSPLFPDSGSDGLIWPFTPNITYAPIVDYQNHALAFANQDYYSYSKTPSAAIQIVGQFTAQSPSEARYALACIHFLRVVTKMHFGEAEKRKSSQAAATAGADSGAVRDSLSEPPPKLLFSAYGKFGFKDIPVYVQNFSIDFSDQVNHVPIESLIYFGGTSGVKQGATRTTWIPANFTMTVSLQPQIHPADWNHPSSASRTQFNWNDFATGKLFERSSGGWL